MTKYYTHNCYEYREVEFLDELEWGILVREEIGTEHFICKDLCFKSKNECILDMISDLEVEESSLKFALRDISNKIIKLNSELEKGDENGH